MRSALQASTGRPRLGGARDQEPCCYRSGLRGAEEREAREEEGEETRGARGRYTRFAQDGPQLPFALGRGCSLRRREGWVCRARVRLCDDRPASSVLLGRGGSRPSEDGPRSWSPLLWRRGEFEDRVDAETRVEIRHWYSPSTWLPLASMIFVLSSYVGVLRAK